MAKETRTYEQGGKCYFCGCSTYYGALDFHHKDESSKSFALSTDKLYRAWNIIMAELDKCVLLCSNCHRELHGGLRQIMVK